MRTRATMKRRPYMTATTTMMVSVFLVDYWAEDGGDGQGYHFVVVRSRNVWGGCSRSK